MNMIYRCKSIHFLWFSITGLTSGYCEECPRQLPYRSDNTAKHFGPTPAVVELASLAVK